MTSSVNIEHKIFDVTFEASGKSVGKLRNEISVRITAPFESESMMATDEGEFQGGEGTAPTPLEYFAVGLVGCLMTQLRVFSKKMRITVRDTSVDARLNWFGSRSEELPPGQPYSARPLEFEVDIDFESDSSIEDLKTLVQAAQDGCFVEQSLSQAFGIRHRFRRNLEKWVEVD